MRITVGFYSFDKYCGVQVDLSGILVIHIRDCGIYELVESMVMVL